MKKLCLIAYVILLNMYVNAQSTGTGIGGPPDPSAKLDIQSNNSGVIFPRMTTGERDGISSPARGLMIYNTDCDAINIFTGGAWTPLSSTTGSMQSVGIGGNQSPCQSTTNEAYSISDIPTATNYTWTVPVGAVLISGQGTISITVDLTNAPVDQNIGNNVCVWASNACQVSPSMCLPLYIQPPVTIPTDLTVSNHLGTSFTAQWNSGEPGFYIDVSADPDFTSFLYENVSVGNPYEVTGLSCATTYYYRLRAQGNCTGISGNSDVATVPPLGTPDAPTALPASDASYHEFTANWNSVNEATDYYVQVATDDNFTSPILNSPFFTNNTSVTITELDCNTTYYYRVMAANGCFSGAYSSPSVSVTTPDCPSAEVPFYYTGSEQQFEVPAGVFSILVDVQGAGGDSVPNTWVGDIAGRGGRVQATLSVTPGEILYIYVGGRNGYNGGGARGVGGGNPYNDGASGGGGSDIRQGGNGLANRVVVGGGGGGLSGHGCNNHSGQGGHGGYTGGEGDNGGGTGGTQTTGGTGYNAGSGVGGNGGFGYGGAGGNSYGGNSGGAGGAGGGWYGGGGGGASVNGCPGGGGGGGSSYGPGGATFTTGYQHDDGQVIITY